MRPTSRPVRRIAAALLLLAAATSPAWVSAFQDPAGSKEQEVQIERTALSVESQQTFKQHLVLAPIRTLEIPAPNDGHLRTLMVKLGAKTAKEAEVIRLDDSRANLVLKGAKARLQAAQIEKSLSKDESQKALLDAKVEAAQADVDLAQFDADKLVVRAPFVGEIHEVHVVEGQFVKAGQPLLTLCDVSQLKAEVPVNGQEVKAGSEIDLRIGENTVKGKVELLLPPARRFEALRDLCDTLQTAVVTFDNTAGKLAAGQSVYCDLIPTDPVAKVATTAVKNRNDGTRKIQILRNNVVRDVAVKIHSKIGTELVYVSGPFRDGDELISKSSIDLVDGTPVRELLSTAAPGQETTTNTNGAARPGTTSKPNKPTTNVNF